MKYRTIVIDPPYPHRLTGQFKRENRAKQLPYKTMTMNEIHSLDIEKYADIGCHLWLWTTNSHLKDSFDLLKSWNFTYLNTITWCKTSGVGAYFANTTQHILMAYYKSCKFNKARWKPTHFITKPVGKGEHSKKPESSYQLIESISDEPRLEIFARTKREGWDYIGDELGVPILVNQMENKS